jgi:hypothetical protein
LVLSLDQDSARTPPETTPEKPRGVKQDRAIHSPPSVSCGASKPLGKGLFQLSERLPRLQFDFRSLAFFGTLGCLSLAVLAFTGESTSESPRLANPAVERSVQINTRDPEKLTRLAQEAQEVPTGTHNAGIRSAELRNWMRTRGQHGGLDFRYGDVVRVRFQAKRGDPRAYQELDQMLGKWLQREK